MLAIVQRVSATVDAQVTGVIGRGFLVPVRAVAVALIDDDPVRVSLDTEG